MAFAAGITGTGSYIPERVMTNRDLELLVDTSDEWITERTGIRERHIAAPEEASSDLGVRAAERALSRAGVAASDLDLIICATVHGDMLFPPTACLIQHRLGADRAAAYDVIAGCTGFMFALHQARAMIEAGLYRKVLVIGSEVLSRILDWQDRSTCVLLGDAAGAVVLERVEQGRGILASRLGSDGSKGELLHMPAGGSRLPASEETVKAHLHTFKMNGRETFKHATRVMGEVSEQVLQDAGLGLDDVDLLIPHQANLRIIQAIAKRLHLPMERVMVNIQKYGNTSAATIPVALDEAVAEERLKSGQVALLVGFGSGLTWAGAVLRW